MFISLKMSLQKSGTRKCTFILDQLHINSKVIICLGFTTSENPCTRNKRYISIFVYISHMLTHSLQQHISFCVVDRKENFIGVQKAIQQEVLHCFIIMMTLAGWRGHLSYCIAMGVKECPTQP